MYKLNTRLLRPQRRSPRPTRRRSTCRSTQALPFLNFTGAQWEMLVAVRNLFKEDLFDGSVYDEIARRTAAEARGSGA